jgi:hypothetical protein
VPAVVVISPLLGGIAKQAKRCFEVSLDGASGPTYRPWVLSQHDVYIAETTLLFLSDLSYTDLF